MQYLDNYLKQLSLDIYREICDKKIVYFDVKYWVYLRDQNTEIQKELATRLTELLDNNKCVFPISETTFWEIMKQDEDRRKVTFELVDKFSQGLTIIDGQERMSSEFYYWIQNLQKIEGLIEPKRLIWSNVHFSVNRNFYADKARLLDENLQRQFFEFSRKFSICDVFRLNPGSIPPFKYKDNIDALNEGKEKYKHENSTFDEMFFSEVGGTLDVFREQIKDVMAICMSEHFKRELSNEELTKIDPTPYCNLIYHSFKLKKITTELPLLKIYSSLHAQLRWNKQRKYKMAMTL